MLSIKQTGVDAVSIVDSITEEIHQRLVILILQIGGLFLGIWGLNAVGMMRLNWFFFFAILILYLTALSSPRKLFAVMGVGVALQGVSLSVKDILSGAATGLKVYYSIILHVLLYLLTITAFFASWSFENNPTAVFPFVAGGVIIFLAAGRMNGSGQLGTMIALALGVVIVGSSLWSTWSDAGASQRQSVSQSEGPVSYAEPPMLLEVCTEGKTPATGRISVFKPLKPPFPGSWVLTNNNNVGDVKIWVEVAKDQFVLQTERDIAVSYDSVYACAESVKARYTGFVWTPARTITN